MSIFSLNQKIFAQRIGDEEKFQIYPKQANKFFLKVMPAELEFIKSAAGNYDTLMLHQGGKDMSAYRLTSHPYELYDTIMQLDSLVYAAYNAKDLNKMMMFFSPDLEFYHDQTGKTNYKDNLEIFRENFLKPVSMRRELQKGSIEIFPIAEYGAIETGIHNFFQTNGQSEKLVAHPHFMHIWKRTSDGWKIERIVSYNH